MNPLLYILICMVPLFGPLSSPASDEGPQPASELAAVIGRIKEKERSVKHFHARFSQTRKTTLLREPLRSEGQVFYDREGKMLFEVIHPDAMTVILKDGMLTIFYPDLSETKQRYLGKDFLREYFGVGQSMEELEKRYSVRLVNEPSPDRALLILKPKSGSLAKRIESIELAIDLRSLLPERVSIREPGGDFTHIHLDFISIDRPLPPELFGVPSTTERETRF
jgi:outer membrane lipoprotein-sorting protein